MPAPIPDLSRDQTCQVPHSCAPSAHFEYGVGGYQSRRQRLPLPVSLVCLEHIVPERGHHPKITVVEPMMHTMRGPSSLQPSEGDLVDPRGMLQMVKCPEVKVSSGESAKEKRCTVNSQHVYQQQPDWHKDQKARREEKRRGLLRIDVMSFVRLKQNAAWIMKPAMDRVLDQAEHKQTGQRTD